MAPPRRLRSTNSCSIRRSACRCSRIQDGLGQTKPKIPCRYVSLVPASPSATHRQTRTCARPPDVHAAGVIDEHYAMDACRVRTSRSSTGSGAVEHAANAQPLCTGSTIHSFVETPGAVCATPCVHVKWVVELARQAANPRLDRS